VFAVDVVEGDLHVVLGLAFLDLPVRLGLLREQGFEDALVLSSRFVLEQYRPQSFHEPFLQDVR
jgi:hypothetical protein